MTESKVYSSDAAYIFTTRYADFELSSNKHPEATVTIPAKSGYNIKIVKLTVNICAQVTGQTAYCTYLLGIDSKLNDPGVVIKTTSNSYTPMELSINKTIETANDIKFYLHLKTSVTTSKAMVKNFTIVYQYVSKETVTITPVETTGDTKDYIIYLEGTESDVKNAIEEIQAKFPNSKVYNP